MNETLKEIRDILKQIERNTRPFAHRAALEAKNFDTWLSQYDEETDISEPPVDDPEPYVPTQACSQEDMERALKAHREWEERQNYRNNFKVNDYYVK